MQLRATFMELSASQYLQSMSDLLPDSANDINLARPTLQKCAQRNWLTTNLSALFQNKRVIIKLVIILGRCLKSISALLVHEQEVFI